MSGSWRDDILNEFAPEVTRLTLVADPDGLLTEEGVLQGIRERGYELFTFDDHVAFRFAYEAKYRARWDRGETNELVVVLRKTMGELRELPYDLLKAGRQLSFSLVTLFPNLDPNSVAALDRSDFEALFEAQRKYAPEPLGERATRDFILRHVFGLAPELVKNDVDLLRLLLQSHASEHRLPEMLARRVVDVLAETGNFEAWPLEQLVLDPAAFLGFLQERWPWHLDQLALTSSGAPGALRESLGALSPHYPGPTMLPFDHTDIRALVDTLFLEGKLQPVDHPAAAYLAKQWVAVGLRRDLEADRRKRLSTLVDRLGIQLPPPDARYQDWLNFAQLWAQVLALRYGAATPAPVELEPSLNSLQGSVDAGFAAWALSRFKSLPNLPPRPPVMVHHIVRALAPVVVEHALARLALIVMDGLAFDQWITIRDVLQQQQPTLVAREAAAFAWVPTLTSVSRQAIFAGQIPLFFPGSIMTTDREPSLWSAFWEKQGLPPNAIGYARALRRDSDLATVDQLISQPSMRVIGLVVDRVDQIMHGMFEGPRGMHQQVRLWTEQGFLSNLMHRLGQSGYRVYLTADHGNVQAHGIGNPGEQALADVRGVRARIYSAESLRSDVQGRFPTTIAWPSDGLPEGFLPLLASGRTAFIANGEEAVSHGSISLEEVIVPFVEIGWRTD